MNLDPIIGWITLEWRQMALALDRFSTIRQQELSPWIEETAELEQGIKAYHRRLGYGG